MENPTQALCRWEAAIERAEAEARMLASAERLATSAQAVRIALRALAASRQPVQAVAA